MKNHYSLLLVALVACLLLPVTIAELDPEGDDDEDEVKNQYDRCPGTTGTIIDPFRHPEYAGCTCAQLRALVAREEPCTVIDYCFETVIQISQREDCDPENPILIDMLNQQLEQVPHTGELSLVVVAGFYNMSRTPFETYRRLELNEPVVIEMIGFVHEVNQGPAINIDLYADDQLVIPTQRGSGTNESLWFDEEGRFLRILYQQWTLDTQRMGQTNYRLVYDRVVNNVRTLSNETFIVTVVEHIIPHLPNPVIGVSAQEPLISFNEEDDDFLRAVYDEMVRAGVIVTYDLEEVKESIRRAHEHADISKQEQEGRMRISVEPTNKHILKGVRIIEFIPKHVAPSAQELYFEDYPLIIKDDPLIMWSFNEVDEEVERGYDSNREIVMTGNTIITVEEVVKQSTPLHIILPIIIIPLIIFMVTIVLRKRK